MKFEWYVINGDFNKKTTRMFNVFNNIHVQEYTEKAVKKYLRAPRKFRYHKSLGWTCTEDGEFTPLYEDIYGFDALVMEIDSIIRWHEGGRCEYEIIASEPFYPENETKWDCYEQCKPNMVSITHEVLRQYKEQLKEQKND